MIQRNRDRNVFIGIWGSFPPRDMVLARNGIIIEICNGAVARSSWDTGIIKESSCARQVSSIPAHGHVAGIDGGAVFLPSAVCRKKGMSVSSPRQPVKDDTDLNSACLISRKLVESRLGHGPHITRIGKPVFSGGNHHIRCKRYFHAF